jgi:hypothetical protein
VLGHNPCLQIHKFNVKNTFYIILCPSVGVLRVSFFWNFDFIVVANSTRKGVLEGNCSAMDLMYFVVSFRPRNVVWHQYYVFYVASKIFCPEFI